MIKNLLTKSSKFISVGLFVLAVFVSASNVTLAQWDDDWGIYDTTYQGNYGNWGNVNVDYVDNVCGWSTQCPTNTSWDTTIVDDWGIYNTPNQGSYNTWANPNVDFVSPYCMTYDCSPTTPSYTVPSYTAPTYTSPTYTSPTYTTPTYTQPSYTGYTTPNTYYTAPTTYPTYTSPTYTTPTYTTPTYNPAPTYITPTYTQPTYTTPTYTQPTYTQPSYNWNTSTNTNTNTNSTYAPVWNYNTNTNTNTNTNINNTCAGQNNCNINTNTTFTTVNNNNSISGSFNNTYTQPTYTQPTPVCTNGATNYPGCNVCPSGLVFQNGSCIHQTTNCPSGQYWNGSMCVTQTRTCPSGQVVNYWEVCPNQTQTCWNGTVIPVSSVCPSQYKICPSGTTIPITQQCYKICPNGTTVPDTQVCYRICPSGTSIPENQVCPIVVNYPTVDININPSIVNRGDSAVLTWTSQNATYCTASNGWSGSVNLQGSMNRSNLLDTTVYTITCYNSQNQSATDSTTVTVRQYLPTSHRVVTTAPTQITKTSARCNGVGIISNGVYSNGWFEYGETRDLGRVTNSASIGNLPSSPFGNQITGLKSNTTYYCRAVMSNANGTYRGEIMSFRTTGDSITYIPVTPTNPKTPIKPIICTDDTGAKESLVDGEKLMSITLDKKSGTVAVGNEVEYRAHYMNTSKIKLTNATIKMVLPSDMTFVSSNRGVYDENNNTVVANLDTVGAGMSDDLIVRAKVKDNASVGKSAVISTYISYDALDTKGNPIRDENTAYIVSTIAGVQTVNQNDTNTNQNVSKTDTDNDRSFLPNTVLEWLAIIALILVLIVLGRSIYGGIKGEAHKGHH